MADHPVVGADAPLGDVPPAAERLERLQAEDLEMKIDERAGRLVAVADIETMWTSGIVAARAELMTLADRLKDKLDSTYRINADPTIIESEVLQALSKLAGRATELAVGREQQEAIDA